MKISTLILFLLLKLSSADVLSQCTEYDVCSTIVFNQLAITSIQEDMKTLLDSLNQARSDEDANQGRELNQCLERTKELQYELTSLEKKNTEIMSRDEGWEDENVSLKQEIENLKKFNNDLEEEKMRLQELVTEKEKQIMNLTLSSYMPVDCADVQIKGQKDTGVYTIYPYRTLEAVEVVCDMESDGGGWTVFFTRQEQSQPLDLNESWESFKYGFGDVKKEHWLGNDLIHTLSGIGPSSLRLDAEDFSGESRWATWRTFNVGNEENMYRLTVGDFVTNNTMGDSLSRVTGSFFTTYDIDNDEHQDLNCAVGTSYSGWGKGGWWYKACGSSRLTSPLKPTNDWDSACWQFWDTVGEKLVSLKTVSMKLRRHNYQDLASRS